VLPDSPYLKDSKMGRAIFMAPKLTHLCMETLYLKDFKGLVCDVASGPDLPKEGQNTGVGRPAPVSQKEGSLFRTPTSNLFKKD